MREHVSVYATVTDRWGEVSEVYAGSVEAWAWEDRKASEPWRKVMRKTILEDRTSDPRGWRVVFHVVADEDAA